MARYAEKEAPLLERIIMQEGLERTKAEDWARDEITRLRGQVEALNNERDRLWNEKLKEMSAFNEITRLREEKSILQQQLSNTNHCLEKTQKENVRLKNTRGCGRC